MTYIQNTAKTAKSERYYDAVETDVRRAMKEACKSFKEETNRAIRAYRSRKTKERARALFLASVLIVLTGCGLRVEWYGYSPDEFERNDRQAKTAHYERMPK